MTALAPPRSHPGPGLRHEAVLVSGTDDLLARAVPFVRDGLADDEPVMVALVDAQWQPLRAALGDAADLVHHVDMAELGRNPARLLPAWHDFIDRHGAGTRPLRGLGAPVWAGRTAAEVAECHLHEALLNVALRPGTPLWLLCPYDVAALPARGGRGAPQPPDRHRRRRSAPRCRLRRRPCPRPVAPRPPAGRGPRGGRGLRARRPRRGAPARPAAGDPGAWSRPRRGPDPRGERADREQPRPRRRAGRPAHLVRAGCAPVRGRRLRPPRRRPGRAHPTGARAAQGRGVWMVNQLCDLVQIRSTAAGTVVRVHSWV